MTLSNMVANIGDCDGVVNPTPRLHSSRAHAPLAPPVPGGEYALRTGDEGGKEVGN